MNEAENTDGKFSETVEVPITESDQTKAFPVVDTEDSVTFQVDEDENTPGNTTSGFKDEYTFRYTNDPPTTTIVSSSSKLMSCRRTKLGKVFTWVGRILGISSAPYATLIHFKQQNSTSVQRGFMMSWVVG